MKQTSSIEPGLLNNFRLLSGIKLFIVFLIAFFRYFGYTHFQSESSTDTVVVFLLLESSVLLIYLSIPWLQRKLRILYLPIALFYITISTLVFNFLSLYYQVERNLFFLIASELQLIPLLFIPLVFIAWQYRFRVVIVFCLFTALAQVVIIHFFTNTQQILMAGTYGVIVVRTLSFFTVGYMVSQLMASQRKQRKQLAQANITLSRYNDTFQQLILSQERNRLSRELHDTLAHTLGGIAIQIEAIQTVVNKDDERVQNKLQQILEATRSGLKETRRVLKNLRASPLDDLGLKLAIESYAMSVSERANLNIKTQIDEEFILLNPEIEQGIFRIIQETLENIVRHASADHVVISMKKKPDLITLMINDDGHGFDPSLVETENKLGIKGMQERARLLGGTLDIDSNQQGTAVIFNLEI